MVGLSNRHLLPGLIHHVHAYPIDSSGFGTRHHATSTDHLSLSFSERYCDHISLQKNKCHMHLDHRYLVVADIETNFNDACNHNESSF